MEERNNISSISFLAKAVNKSFFTIKYNIFLPISFSQFFAESDNISDSFDQIYQLILIFYANDMYYICSERLRGLNIK